VATSFRVCLVALLLALSGGGSVRASGAEASAKAAQQDDESIRILIDRIERMVQTGDAQAFVALHEPADARTRAADFAASELMPGAARAVLRERDRAPFGGTGAGGGYRLMLDLFAEYGSRARVSTWRLDIGRSDAGWTIVDEERLSGVESLYRLAVNGARQFAAHGLHIAAEDLDLTLDGSVFVADVDLGTTALLLLGRGTMNFHPTPDTEKGQVRIFCGADALDTRFEAAYLRLNPGDFDNLVASAQVAPVPVDARELRRAQELFRVESQKSFVIDLGDLSRDAWSLLPSPGDFLAEVRTRKYDTLTYAKSANEAEDITFFDRRRHKNIALYPSAHKLMTRGRFYNEDDLVDYDVLDYKIDITAIPERYWIEGRATLRLRVRAYVLGTLTLKLADSLAVQSIVSDEFGRLFGIRVKNQNTIVVNLPTLVARGREMTLDVAYGGRLEPQAPDRETIAPGQNRSGQEDQPIQLVAETNLLYSNRSFWYPQAPVSDYATARIQIAVPTNIDCVASGELEPGFPGLITAKDPAQARKVYLFSASQPLRYLAFILSRFTRTATSTVAFPSRERVPAPKASNGGIFYRSLNLSIETNPRQTSRGRELSERAADIATFYESIVGDSPYPSFTVALIESDLPGGHSPAYFAALNQPLPTSPLTWRNDPASFTGFPDFFIAHEIAHQWWGQAVGWQNYHEQWLSEGFAQYFAALYAQHQRGDETFGSVLKVLRKWALEYSAQGPVYLGYRLGHIRGEGRVFRALVYDKGAAVLHMLRRLVGDEAFFNGLRRFYRASRFHKAGTEDLKQAMEAETGRSFERFFDRWIYGSSLPTVKFGYRIEGGDAVLRFEQVGELFDVPVTMTLQYADRKAVDVVVPLADRVVETRVPLAGALRGVEFNKADGELVEVIR